MNVMNMVNRQLQQQANAMIEQIKQQGFTPQQAYDELMKNPQFVQSVNVARQQYPNMSYRDIAMKHGFGNF